MPQLLQRLLDDGELVGRVVDDEVARQADRAAPRGAAAARTASGTSTATRRRQSAPSSDSTRSRISSAALLVNVTASTSSGSRVAVADEVRDAEGDDARLARARAGEDQQRARRCAGRLRVVRDSACRGNPWGEFIIRRCTSPLWLEVRRSGSGLAQARDSGFGIGDSGLGTWASRIAGPQGQLRSANYLRRDAQNLRHSGGDALPK